LYPDNDSSSEVDKIGQELSSLLEEQSDLKLPIFKRFAERALKRTNDFNALLLNDDSLLNEKGKEIAQLRNLWREVSSSFAPDSRDSAIQALEDLIDEKLPTQHA